MKYYAHLPPSDTVTVSALMPDGTTATLRLDGAALARLGIHKGITTLQAWKRKRRLPCRKHNREVVFYLDEVLNSIGGRY